MKTNKDLVDRASVLKAIDEYERLSMVNQTARNMTSPREIVQWLPSAQPQYEELTPEEAASEIASGSIMSAKYWLDVMIRIKQMGVCNMQEKIKDDTISRQAAIDAVHEEFDDCLVWDESGQRTADEFEIIINRLPSAQPERTPAHACDLIDRQAAINAVKKNTFRLTFAEEQGCEGHVAWSAYAVYSDVMEGALLELPSAQPQITHCAECIHWKYSDVRKSYCEVFDWMNKAEDFCSFAERRSDE